MKYLLFLLSLGLFSGQAAMARPWLYASTFRSSAPGYECLNLAADVLKDEGFTRHLETKEFTGNLGGKGGSVQGYLRNYPVVAEIKCNQSLGFRMLIVSGNDSKLTYNKYSSLYDNLRIYR